VTQAGGLTRIVLAALAVLFLCTYIAAKVDFFRNYSRLGTGAYLREHSIYWAAIAAIAFVAWLVERRFPR
jgi:uncharacterized membrane protein YqhA